MPTLNQLSLGDQAVVSRIDGTDAIAMRLMEMGLFEGETIRFIGKAPLGDPLEYEVCGCIVSLRAAETFRVHLELNSPCELDSSRSKQSEAE